MSGTLIESKVAGAADTNERFYREGVRGGGWGGAGRMMDGLPSARDFRTSAPAFVYLSTFISMYIARIIPYSVFANVVNLMSLGKLKRHVIYYAVLFRLNSYYLFAYRQVSGYNCRVFNYCRK